MLELDKTLKAWQQAVVTNNSVMLRRMESILRNQVNESFDVVVQGLESPAPALARAVRLLRAPGRARSVTRSSGSGLAGARSAGVESASGVSGETTRSRPECFAW